MNKIYFFLVIYFFFFVTSQAQIVKLNLKDAYIYPIIGARMHTNTVEANKLSDVSAGIIYAPIIGLALEHADIRTSLSFQYDFNINLITLAQDRQTQFNTAVLRRVNQLNLYHHFSSFSLGAGYYWKNRTNLFYYPNQPSPGVDSKISGIQVMFSMPLNSMEIEYRWKIATDPFIELYGLSQHSICMLWRINKKHYKLFEKRKWKSFIQPSLLIGSRFMYINYTDKFLNFAPTIGLELLVDKYNLSFNIEKDIWFALNGDNLTGRFNEYITNDAYSIKYHHQLKNKRSLRYGIGWALITDAREKRFDLNAPIDTSIGNKLYNYDVKGISTSISYELFKNTDVELRQIFAYIGDDFYNLSRFSLGVIYRHSGQ